MAALKKIPWNIIGLSAVAWKLVSLEDCSMYRYLKVTISSWKSFVLFLTLIHGFIDLWLNTHWFTNQIKYKHSSFHHPGLTAWSLVIGSNAFVTKLFVVVSKRLEWHYVETTATSFTANVADLITCDQTIQTR